MADYIYLLENRLSSGQRASLRAIREVARSKGLTVFLVGGAVRDLTSGSPVRDLDVVVQGNALKLKKDVEKAGFLVTGEMEAAQALYVSFPGNVRMEVGSTLSVTFPKPGKAVMKPATILDDLRRRDFTANAMALSLNEGSYGLLMDPLNGVADIENRELRLVSNYGFIEDPVRMIRAARLMARLGWTLDEKTQTRYETGKQEGYVSVLSEFSRGYETEEIVHEEDPLRVLRRLEAEGWMKVLAPYWTAAKVNVAELERLRDAQAQLQMQGIQPDMASASFPLLTAKLSPKEVGTLKAGFPRRGFVKEIEALEGEGKEFAGLLGGKGSVQASQSWKLIMGGRPEVVLHTAYASKSPALQAKFKSFYTEWPQARQKMPYVLMQEMRITPELPGYEDLLEKLFFELMDGKLGSVEEMKAFLEPYSPPAPPPPVSMRRMRAQKKEGKPSKSRSKKAADEAPPSEEAAADELPRAEEQPAAISAASEAPVAANREAVKPVIAKTSTAKAATSKPAVKVVAPQAAPAKTASVKPAGKKPDARATVEAKRVVKGPMKQAAKAVPTVAKKVAVKLPVKTSAKSMKAVPVKTTAGKKTVKQPSKSPVNKTVKAVAKKVAAKKVPSKKTTPVKTARPATKAGAAAAKTPAKKIPAKKTPAKKIPAKKIPAKATRR